MIGTCKIPLQDLAKGVGIDGKFDIRGPNGEARGKAVIKITIMSSAINQGNAASNDMMEN